MMLSRDSESRIDCVCLLICPDSHDTIAKQLDSIGESADASLHKVVIDHFESPALNDDIPATIGVVIFGVLVESRGNE
jgi:hypothetical protein